MRRLLPFPLTTLALLALWLLLVGSAKPGSILLGSVLALIGGYALVLLEAPRLRPRRLLAVPRLLIDVLVEVVRSNNAVVRLILNPAERPDRRAAFVQIPLSMRNPYGLAVLACILTSTPGTVWVDYDAEKNIMLLHVLDMVDEEEWVRIVKDRWETRLMEIFP